jgi:hypothetical protein
MCGFSEIIEKTFMDYKKLEVWVVTRQLTKLTYTATITFPAHEIFGLTNQIRRAAISASSNIAEGCGRKSTKETIHFYILRGVRYMNWKYKFLLHLT